MPKMTQIDIEIARDTVNYAVSKLPERFKGSTCWKEALSRIEAATQWRPIDTAPNPSGQVLLAVYNKAFSSYEVYNRHWYKLENRWVYDCHIFGQKGQPEFWLPLPAAPEIKEAGDECGD